MFGWSALAVALAMGIGLVVKALLVKYSTKTYYREAHQISWREFAAVSLLLALLIAPGSAFLGTKLSVKEQLLYTQFLNGVETDAVDNVTNCQAGYASSSSGSTGKSNCDHVYVSGHYYWEWPETVTTCTSDDKGNQTCTSTVVIHTERAEIETPYATREHRYTINSWMYDGDDGTMSFKFAGTYLDAKPTRHPKSTREIPGSVPKGPPADWQAAKDHLDAGNPRWVTKLGWYKNYILAAKDDLLKAFGPRLDEYKAAGLLPEHTEGIMSSPIIGPSASQANKVSFVGVDVPDKAAWQTSVMRFNSALGMQLQGDLHVVLIDAATVPWTDAEPYTQSLKAYWQSDAFGRRAIAKNGIILVMGVDKATNTVAWADASTGMPFGNELMIQYLRDNLPGNTLNPDALFGTPVTVVRDNKATTTHPLPLGAVEDIVFNKATFKRFSMSCDGEDCIGFTALISKIKPTLEAKIWVFAATTVVAILFWLVVALTTIVDAFIHGLGRWLVQHVLPHKQHR